MRLDLGGGLAPAPGHINIDIISAADLVWDLNQGLPDEIMFAKGQWPEPVEGIRCMHVIEHLDTIIPLMNDCFMVMKSGAELEISTPLAGTTEFWQDPTHKKGYVRESFLYFLKDSPFAKEQKEYHITARFIEKSNIIMDHWQLCVVLKKP